LEQLHVGGSQRSASGLDIFRAGRRRRRVLWTVDLALVGPTPWLALTVRCHHGHRWVARSSSTAGPWRQRPWRHSPAAQASSNRPRCREGAGHGASNAPADDMGQSSTVVTSWPRWRCALASEPAPRRKQTMGWGCTALSERAPAMWASPHLARRASSKHEPAGPQLQRPLAPAPTRV